MRVEPRSFALPVLTLASIGGVWAGDAVPALLRLLAGVPLATVLPGIALTWGRSRGWGLPARLAFVGGASFAVTILVGLGLNFVEAMNPHGWALGLGLITLAVWATSARSATDRGFPKIPLRILWPLAAFVAAGTMAAGAVVVARQGAEKHREFAFTEFWLLPVDGTDRRLLTVGIRNGEGRRATYAVDLIVDGGVVGHLPPVDLAPNEVWSTDFAFPVDEKARKVEAWLYEDGMRSNVYRKAWVWN